MVFVIHEPSATFSEITLMSHLEEKPLVVGMAKTRTGSCTFDSSQLRPARLCSVSVAKFDTNLFCKHKSKADI